MKKLYLIIYFDEMENENDADVFVFDDSEDKKAIFKKFFKELRDYEIEDEHIVGIYPVPPLHDNDGAEYELVLKKTN